NQRQATDRANRLIQAVDDAADVYPRCRGFHQHSRIQRWIEQGKWANDALDVHAVANLKQPIGDRVPIGQHPVVGRQAEVESAADAKERSASVGAIARGPGELRSEVERELALKLYQSVANGAKSLLFKLLECFRLHRSLRRNAPWF